MAPVAMMLAFGDDAVLDERAQGPTLQREIGLARGPAGRIGFAGSAGHGALTN